MFLDLTRPGFDLGDRGVTGRQGAGTGRCIHVHRARHLPGGRHRSCPGARPRRRRAAHPRPAAHLHLQAAGRRRIPAGDDARSRRREPLDRAAAAAKRAARHLDRCRLYRSDGRARRGTAVPGRGLRAGPDRVHADAAGTGAAARNGNAGGSRWPVPLWRAGVGHAARGRGSCVLDAQPEKLRGLCVRPRR